MLYGKGEEKTGIVQNPTEAKRDYGWRDLAQAKTERHNFKGNLESNFKKCTGCEPSTQAWILASGALSTHTALTGLTLAPS